MNKSRLWIFASAVTLLSMAAFVAYAADQVVKGRPTAVGVVDMEKVLDNLKEKTQVEADLKSRQDQVIKDRTAKQTELNQLKEDLNVLGPNTAKYKEAQESLEKKLYDFQAWDQWQNASLAREYRLQGQALQNKVATALGKIAEQNGFDVVLPKQQNLRIPMANGQAVDQGIRVALWSKDDLDLTAQVITVMNNEYQNRPK